MAIVEAKQRGSIDEETLDSFRNIKHEVKSAVSECYRLRVADVVLVAPGSIPITTGGKVRRFACAERYLRNVFDRLDTAG